MRGLRVIGPVWRPGRGLDRFRLAPVIKAIFRFCGEPSTTEAGLSTSLHKEDVGDILHYVHGFCQPTHARMARNGCSIFPCRSVFATGARGFQPAIGDRDGSVSRPAGRGTRSAARPTGRGTCASSVHRTSGSVCGMKIFSASVTSRRSAVPSLYVISSYVAPAQPAQDDAVGRMAPLHTPTMSATSLRGHQ